MVASATGRCSSYAAPAGPADLEGSCDYQGHIFPFLLFSCEGQAKSATLHPRRLRSRASLRSPAGTVGASGSNTSLQGHTGVRGGGGPAAQRAAARATQRSLQPSFRLSGYLSHCYSSAVQCPSFKLWSLRITTVTLSTASHSGTAAQLHCISLPVLECHLSDPRRRALTRKDSSL